MQQQSHYFIEDNTLKDNIEEFSYHFKGNTILLKSNSGMFSPGHIDEATDLLLRTLTDLQGEFLDLGCGYGVIGIAVKKAFDVNVTLADVNARALKYAKENCTKNGVGADIIQSDSFKNINKNFDSITLNPPIHAGKQVVFDLYQGSFEHLNSGGKLYVVIQKKHGALSTQHKLEELFSNCETVYKKKGFFVFCAKKTD